MYIHKQIHMYVCEYIYVYACVHAWSFCRVWLCSPVDCRLPDFSDVFRQEYWNEFRQEFWMFLGKNTGVVAISFSRGSSWLRDRTRISCVSCIGRQILFFFFFFLTGESANAVPHYHKLCSRVSHIWGNRRGQRIRSAMDKPRPGKTTFVIMVSPLAGRFFTTESCGKFLYMCIYSCGFQFMI